MWFGRHILTRGASKVNTLTGDSFYCWSCLLDCVSSILAPAELVPYSFECEEIDTCASLRCQRCLYSSGLTHYFKNTCNAGSHEEPFLFFPRIILFLAAANELVLQYKSPLLTRRVNISCLQCSRFTVMQ